MAPFLLVFYLADAISACARLTVARSFSCSSLNAGFAPVMARLMLASLRLSASVMMALISVSICAPIVRRVCR